MPGRKGFDRLWAPWRIEYVGRDAASNAPRGSARAGRRASAEPDPDCLFCRVRRVRDDRADLVLARRPSALLMLNRYPYNPAHLMVAAGRHVAQFCDLSPEESEDLVGLTALAERALAAEYRPHGLNYGVNVGRVAGAGFVGHLHLHLVPRWNGDTNFMATVAETRVLPESLGRTWRRLRTAVREIESAPARKRRRPAGRVG